MSDANQARWTKMANQPAAKGSKERAAFNLAQQNADDTSAEQGFELHSPRWYQAFTRTYDATIGQELDPAMIEDWSF